MGLTPYEYYCLTPYEFYCIVKGWKKKQASTQALLRKHAQIIYGCAGGKENFQKFWPIDEIDALEKSNRPTKKIIGDILANAKRKELERRLLQSKLN
jgi:hypothetical protein